MHYDDEYNWWSHPEDDVESDDAGSDDYGVD
jgi:hypothetical protein